VYFTLAISAASALACGMLTRTALGTDPAILPIPGPVSLMWRSADERAAMIRWGAPGPAVSGVVPGAVLGAVPAAVPGAVPAAVSYAGTIRADPSSGMVHVRTGIARVDPVYVARLPDAVVMSDRASWAAAVCDRLTDHDPVMIAAFLNLGYPLGSATPFRGVHAMDRARYGRAAAGKLTVRDADRPGPGSGAAAVAAALVDAVAPLGDEACASGARSIELSLTGGKDSRLIAAALTAAKVPFHARTHGAADHPDVVVAGTIAARLGIEHVVTRPRPPGTADVPGVLARLRSTVLVSDGTLSAFENVGRADPSFAADPVQVGGHGGELLRGGYACYTGNLAWAYGRGAELAWAYGRGAEQFRRLTTSRLGLLRPAAARAYLAGLAPWAPRFARGPLRALDDFYLANRAGRWSAAARQAYLLRSELVQPFFDDTVVRAARGVPLRERAGGQLHRELLEALCPDLLDIPLAGRAPATPAAVSSDWRRHYGDHVAVFLRDYVLDHGSALFDVVSRRAAERVLRVPHADHDTVWALATIATLVSGDWLHARTPQNPC
jgi:Asparagine synthase